VGLVIALVLGLGAAFGQSVVRVGFYENPPKLYTDDSARIVGFFPEIIEEIAAQEGWTVEYVPGTWAECLARLEAGEIDLMPDVAYSGSRAAIYGFSEEPLFVNWGVIYQHPSAEIESIPDLIGKRIAVMEGSIHTVGEQGVVAMLAAFDIDSTFVEYPDYTAVFEALEAGEADAGAVNRLFGLLSEDAYDIEPTTIVFNPRELRFAYPIDSEFGAQLAARIDHNIRAMKAAPDSVYYRSLATHLLREARGDVLKTPGWLPWALGGAGGIIVLSALAILFLRRRQRRLRTKLAASEIQFEAMFEKAAVGIVVLKAGEGRFLGANPRFCEMMGYEEAELLQLDASRVLHPEDPGRDAPAVQDVVEGRSDRLVSEERLVRKDGSIIWGRITRSMVKGPDGEPAYGIGVIEDITERVRSEEALRESEKRFRSVIEQSIDGLVLTDSDGRILEWNRGQELITGIPAQDAVGQLSWDVQFRLLPPGETPASDLLSRLRTGTLGLLAGEESPRELRLGEVEIERPDGTRRMIEVGSFPIDLGGSRILGNVVRDISEQKAAEQELERHRAHLEELVAERTEDLNLAIEAANSTMFRYDLVTGAVERDERWFEITGIARAQFDGTHAAWQRLVHPDDLAKAQESIDAAVASDRPMMHHEYRILRPDGQTRYIETHARIQRDETGRATSLVGMNVDVTQRREMELAIENERHRLDMAIDYADAAMFEHDLQANRLQVGERWFEMFDIPEQGFDGRIETWRERVHPEDLPSLVQAFRDTYSQPEASSMRAEFRIVRRNSEIRHIESRSTIIRDAAGTPITTIGLNIDITDRRKAEEALRENEAFMLTMIEHLPIDLFAVDRDLRYMMQSPASRAAIGDMVGKRVDETDFPEQVKEQWIEEHRQVLGGKSLRAENDIVTSDGEVRTYLSNVAPVYVGDEIIASLGTSMDITERKRMEAEILRARDQLEVRVEERTKELRASEQRLLELFEGTIVAFARTVEARDPYTAGHQQRVADLATLIAKRIGLPEDRIEGTRVAGLLHDIGKIAVPAEILAKPTKLTPLEWGMIQEHSRSAVEILGSIPFPWPIAEIIIQHHERLDGSGYPDGLKGEDILLEARILAVADTVEAMAAHRPYRAALGVDVAVEEIRTRSGKTYDPKVVDACIALLEAGDFSFVDGG